MHTINPRIRFDPDKERSNVAKHNISLTKANDIEWDSAATTEDLRHQYGERRWITLAYIGERLYCMVYVIRDEHYRIISLRKANTREVQRYAKT